MSKKSKKLPTKKIGSDFAFQLKLKNDLPEVPFDPLLLPLPQKVDRLYKYFEFSLLKDRQHDLIHPDGELGMPSNPFEFGFLERALKHPDEILVPRKDLLDPRDQALLVDPVSRQSDSRTATSVPWLKRTEYISTERNVYGRSKSAALDSKLNGKQASIQELLDLTPQEQVDRIEKTFDLAKNALLATMKHPKNSELEALEIFPIYPDFEYWTNPFILSSYDADPIIDKTLFDSEKDREISWDESILKPLDDPETEEQFAAYYLPTKESLKKIKHKRELEADDLEVLGDETYEHVYQRDLDFKLESSSYPFFLDVRTGEGAFYNQLGYHMKFRKRELDAASVEKPSHVVLKHRPLTDEETLSKQERMQTLLQRDVTADEV